MYNHANLVKVKVAINRQLMQQYHMLDETAMKIADNVVIVDPMDRIRTDNAIRVADFENMIATMVPISPEKFTVLKRRR